MKKLKSIREYAGLSQTQLASKSGVSVRMIRAYEAEAESASKDINSASVITVLALSNALNCKIEDLIE